MKYTTTTTMASLLLAAVFLQAAPPDWSMAEQFYADRKASRIGDLVTVLIEEETEASKDAQNKSNRRTKLDGGLRLGHPTIDNRTTAWTNVVLPSYSLDAGGSFEGGGSLQNKDKFVTRITVTVTDLLPNGNLLVTGKRVVSLQNESVEIHLSGVIRPRDIAQDNTIPSAHVAEATIRYVSSGPIAQNQKRGILTRFIDWINPF